MNADSIPFSFFRVLGVRVLMLSVVVFAGGWFGSASAQDLSLEASSLHDENIFDSYKPLPDNITQFQLSASRDWDYDASSLTASYYGSLLLFRDLTARNYHVHLVSLFSTFHFESDDEEEEEEEEEEGSAAVEDSSGDEEDSSSVAPAPAPPAVHSDSLDRFLYLSASGASQFDKSEFSQYDNSRFGGSIVWRQPLGERASLRSSYALTYHAYPNIAGISNVENRFTLLAGTSPVAGGWYAASVAFGIKGYTSSASYTYTVGGSGGQGGHGKGGAGSSGAQKTKTVTLNSPAVNQMVLMAEAQQRLSEMVRIRAQAQHFGTPSTAARILPQQLNGTVEQEGMIGLFTSQNEIFDDRYGYSGNSFLAGVEFSMPFSIELGCSAEYIEKTYTIPAMDLSDSLVVASNRKDQRLDIEIDLSKSFSLGGDRSLKPRAELHFLRNNSNAPYYEFDKNTYLVGVEYNF